MLVDLTVQEFIKELGSDSPAPGGGSVSALSGAQAAALFNMVASLTRGKKKYEAVHPEMDALKVKLTELEDFFLEAVDRDTNSFNGVMAAFKMPKDTEEEKAARSAKIQEEYRKATQVPLGVGLKVLELLEPAKILIEKGNQNSLTDTAVGILQLKACLTGAFYNVKINLGAIKDQTFIQETQKTMADATAQVEKITGPLLAEAEAKLALS